MGKSFSGLKFVLLLLSGVWCNNISESTIKNLRKFILDGYDVNARPVLNHEKATIVEVWLYPYHITEMNEERGILTLEARIYMRWQDDHLQWDEKNFSGLSRLELLAKEVWTPDVSILQGRGTKTSPWHTRYVEVNSTGYVEWTPSATLEVYCEDFDYEDYPNDYQTCIITLVSWSQNEKEIVLETEEDYLILDEHFSPNPRWTPASMSSSNERIPLRGEEFYSIIEYELELKRMHVPYAALEYVPTLVARILFLCMFWLTSPNTKFIFASTALLILTFVSVGITITLPSPAAATAALFKVSCSLILCMAAIVVEIAVTALFSCTLSTPSWIETLAKRNPCRFITFCQLPRRSTEELLNENRNDPQGWVLIAILIDRIAFFCFAIVLMFF